MKAVVFVLILFGLASLGVGVYFIRQSQVASTQSQAYETIKPLGKLVDSNCDFMYLDNCRIKNDASLLTVVPAEVDQVLRAHASATVLSYRESVGPEVFASLGNPNSLPVQDTYSVADIITRISLSSGINYKVLIALLASQGKRAWDGEASLSNPLGRRQLSFAEQFAGAAIELSTWYKRQLAMPNPSVTVDGTLYRFDTPNSNLASRALYLYFAQNEDDAGFRAITAPPLSSSDSFQGAWLTLFADSVQ